MSNQFLQSSKQHYLHEVSSADHVPPPIHYRRTFSNPLERIANIKQEDYEMKMTRSFPTELLHCSQELRKPDNFENKLPRLLLEALSQSGKNESELISLGLAKSPTKKRTQSASKISKITKNSIKRKINKANSIETPSLIRSETSFEQPILPIDEVPLYRIINDAVGDLAGLMSSSILKKRIKNHEKECLAKDIYSESIAEDQSLPLSQDTNISVDQTNLFGKGLNLNQKPIPSQLSGYLKSKCTLWRNQKIREASIPTSLSVNASSDKREESVTENKLVNEEEEAQIQYQPNNTVKLVKALLSECSPHNAIYKNIRRCMFPYRINPKDYPDVHTSITTNSKHFLQTLTGHDTVMLNMRPTMIKIHRLLVEKKIKEVNIHQKKLEDDETKRLRQLQVQGIVNPNYDETENATDNLKLSEKPHISYASLRPIFNENPYANSYKCMVKQFNRNLVLKEKEEEDVASIGEVSFVSSTSSYDKNVQDDNVLEISKMSEKNQSTVAIGNQSCKKYMSMFSHLLTQLDKENRLATIYETSEPLMYNTNIKLKKRKNRP